MAIEVIDNRFILKQEDPRSGGTAHVYRASEHATDDLVAVKLYDGRALDDGLRRECFLRERDSLQALEHPGIVRLVAAGHDAARQQHYVALEWLERDLLDYAGDPSLTTLAGPARWRRVASEILRPLLLALGLAHDRQIFHRDISPRNVMLDGDGQPKLTDFGLAKLVGSFRAEMTVRDFHTKPYAPPERLRDQFDGRSDLYSLGMTVLRCLIPEGFQLTEDNVPEAIEACGLPPGAQRYIEALVATNPDDRFMTARLAVAELDRVMGSDGPDGVHTDRRIRLELTRALLDQALGLLELDDEQTALRMLRRDLTNKIPSLKRHVDARSASQENLRLDLIGQDLLYTGFFDKGGSGDLVIVGLRELPEAVLDRRREAAMPVTHQIVFDGRWTRQSEDADVLLEQFAAFEAEAAANAVKRREAEMFDRWAEILAAKSELEARREDPLRYTSSSVESGVITFTLEQDVDEQYLGQERRVSLPSETLVGDVIDVGERKLGLSVRRGNPGKLPLTGRLITDRKPSKRAISRQRAALDALRERTATRKDLGDLLLNASSLPTLTPTAVDTWINSLDVPKQRAVESALASPDFTIVEGPPGTGKTTFITELVAQLLKHRPGTRILLSSQTHVAVDNAAVRLAEIPDGPRIVRVGNPDKVDPDASDLTVSRQLQRWRDEAENRGRSYLTDWGAQRNISGETIAAYALASELAAVRDELVKQDERLSQLAEEEERLEDRLTDPTVPARSKTTTSDLPDELDELTAVQDESESVTLKLAEIAQREGDICGRLTSALAIDATDADAIATALADRHPIDSDHLEQFRRLTELQDEWLLRFGQSQDFTQALLDSAPVVAGTCVGLAASVEDLDSFDVAIIDEASKATPTETLIPMVKCRRWVLVGDTNQLPPYADSALIDEGLLDDHGLSRHDLVDTIFARLASDLGGGRVVPLTEQHRMLKPIGDLISNCFYNGALTSSRPAETELESLAIALPTPVVWLSTSKMRNRKEARVGTTYWNRAELAAIRERLTMLQFCASQKDEQIDVAIISGYGEQALRLRRDLRPDDGKWTHLNLDVHPVDSFQGQERHVVIYSVTRSNPRGDLGFLRLAERINVALSRGRDGLVIVGDANFCQRAKGGRNPLARVLEHIKSNDGCTLEELES